MAEEGVTADTAAEEGGGAADEEEDKESAAMGEVWEKTRKANADEAKADEKPAGKKSGEDVTAADKKEDGEKKDSDKPKDADKKEKPEKKGESDDDKDSGKDKDGDSKDQSKSVDDKKDGENSDKKAEKDYSKAPQNATKAIKEAWDDFSPEVQKEMTDAHAKNQSDARQIGRQRAEVEKREGVLEPVQKFMELLTKEHPDLGDADTAELAVGMARLVGLGSALNKDPGGTILDLAMGTPGMLKALRDSLKDMTDEQLAAAEARARQGGERTEEGGGDADLAARIAKLEKENEDLKNGGLTRQMEHANDIAELEGHLSDFGQQAPHWDTLEGPTTKHLPDVIDANPPDAEYPDLIRQAYLAAHLIHFPGQSLPKLGGSEPAPEEKVAAAEAANDLNVTSASSGGTGKQTEDEILGATFDRLRGGRR